MKIQRLNYPINLMARLLRVARSGYYVWLKRGSTAREIRHARLEIHIREAHALSRETYGPLRLQTELAEHEIIVGRNQISWLRKKMGLKCIQRKKFKATTNSSHDLPLEPNLLNQNFQVKEPGTVWGTNITYIVTDESWLYLAGVKDFGSKEIVGLRHGSEDNQGSSARRSGEGNPIP